MFRYKLLLIAFVFQFILIGAMFEIAYSPLIFGDEVRVKVKGYDPRDIISGNYILLDYDIPLKFDDKLSPSHTDIFIPLELTNDGLYHFLNPQYTKPKDRLFIQVRKSRNRLKLGIEKYYLPEKKAKAYEKKLLISPAIATLKIFKGKARIVDLKFINSP